MASERLQRRVERLLDEIEDVFDARDWQRVLRLAKDVLLIDPNNTDAQGYVEVAERAIAQDDSSGEETLTLSTGDPSDTKTEVESDSQPSSFADGRYQVKRFLGEGGKKKVYLAHDELLDRDVAFALIKTEGLDDASRTRISREAQAMGRLGSHPHIVTVFDLGEHPSTIEGQASSQPYMVTELMGGGDVEGIIENAPEHRLPLEQAINIAIETCRGLDFAHSKGIVHRDLKPGNIWLTSDGIAKIGDFGLAVATDKSRLTQQGMMVGTVSYMPPEQAMGGEVTPRADLYSLGAMLYEMVCGRPPFLGDDSIAIIGQHINTPPVAPTWHNSSCPKPLEALIMRLLAKDPSERPGSASDVLTALEAIDTATSIETPASGDDDVNVLDSLAGGVFVGRQREMGQLKAALEDALSGKGRMVTLLGEPGIGKTRTAQELATYAGLRGCQVLWGRSYEEQGVPPYWPWVQAIRNYVRDVEPERLRSEMGAGAADIAEVISDVKERLPDLKPPPQLDSPESARFRLFDSITAFLKTASLRQPIMLVLDDLHWADKPSLMLLQFVARELTGARLLLVGTYRDVELNRQHPLSETLGELTRERLFERVLLRGLSQENIYRFIEVSSGIVPPAGLVNAVHTQTEGNPLFVTEVVRLLVQEGELTAERTKDRGSWSVRIPEGVREVIGRRLNRLSQRCNETLTIASIIGREFELRQLNRLIDDATEDMLLDVLEEGLSTRVIEELPTAVGRYQFTHALIQETLSTELSLTRRVRLHARIAEMLEELYGDNVEAHAAELAHHFGQAEASIGSDKLVKYCLVAGENALNANAYEQALSHFERALDSKGDQPMDDQKADVIYGLGRAQTATVPADQLIEPIANLRQAFDYYAGRNDVSRAIAVATTQVSLHGIGNEIIDMVEAALKMVSKDSHDAGRLQVILGLHRGGRGELELAREAFDKSATIARREGDKFLEMSALVASANVWGNALRYQETLDAAILAIELARELDSPEQVVLAHVHAAGANISAGNPVEAERQASMARETVEKSRQYASLASALLSSALVYASLGNWEAVRNYSERVLERSPHDARVLGALIYVNLQVGEITKAVAYIAEISESVESFTSAPSQYLGISSFVLSLASYAFGVSERDEFSEKAANIVLSKEPVNAWAEQLARLGNAFRAMRHKDEKLARESFNALIRYPGRYYWFYSLDRVLGLLAFILGNLDDAQSHFEDALAFLRKAGYRPELAWTCFDYGDMLLERDNEGDREKAVSLLDESLAISTELGMRPLMERVLSRREILKA